MMKEDERAQENQKQIYNKHKVKYNMGPFERGILDYIMAQQNESCLLQDLLKMLSVKPDFTVDWVISDVKNLIKDGLLSYDKATDVLTLLPKAKRPVVVVPPDKK